MRVKATCWAFAIAIVLTALMPLAGHAAEYSIGPAPPWVAPTTPGTISAAATSQDSFGEVYLLADTQVLASDQQRVTYHRLVINAVNASGVNSVANIARNIASFFPAAFCDPVCLNCSHVASIAN